jgi:dihydroxyacetone kinase
MKKLINDPKTVVRETLEGMVALAPGCALLQGDCRHYSDPQDRWSRGRVRLATWRYRNARAPGCS